MSTVLTDDEARVIIGANIKRLLREKGWTQRQLALATNDSEMTISNVSRGQHVPGAGLLSRIADQLGVTTDDLLQAGGNKSRRTSAAAG